MKLTAQTVTHYALDEISFEGIIYLVPISNTNTPGIHHYISGFHSEAQCRMYRALLEGKSFDKSYAQSETRERILDFLVVEATITITPVNEYLIKKTDPVYSTHPHLTSQDLLTMANELLQVEKVTKPNYKIKSLKGELRVVTDGLEVCSFLSSKKELDQAIQNSLAHRWLVERAASKSKFAISHANQLPTTNSKDFLLTAFYTAVKIVIENLREIEELSINDAIQAGNSLIKGQKIISNSFVIHEQIKEALRYRTLAGIE